MILTCPGCATAFTLSDALVPPGGAPVQCSGCKTIFEAQLPQPAPTPRPRRMYFGAPSTEHEESYRSAEGRGVFGAPAAAPLARAQATVFGPPPAPLHAAPVKLWSPGVWPRTPTAPAEERAARFAHAAEHPEDETALLVLSDSLMERGEPQGRLMAFQLEEERATDLLRKVKINVLVRDHSKDWLPPGARHGTFRRGLLDHVEWVGETDPEHLAWRSVRSLRCTLDQVPKASFFDVHRPLLEVVGGLSARMLMHVLEARPPAVRELDAVADPAALQLGLPAALARLTKLAKLTLRSSLNRDARLNSEWLSLALRHFQKLERLRLSLPVVGLDEIVRQWDRLAPRLDLQFVIPYEGADAAGQELYLDARRGVLWLPPPLSPNNPQLQAWVQLLGGDLNSRLRVAREER